MIVKKKIVRDDNVSCSFCDKGELNSSGMGLKYPYKEVYLIKREGSGAMVHICDDCLKEMNSKVFYYKDDKDIDVDAHDEVL